MQLQDKHRDERALLEQISRGNRKAYAELYELYVPRIYKYLFPFSNQSKEDTEEVIQEIFLKIWIRKEKLSDIESFASYLFRMAKNQLLDQYQRQGTYQRILQFIKSEEEVSTVHEKVVYDEYYKIAQVALRKLSPQRRKIFEMRTQQDMAIDDIAIQLNITNSAVKKQLYEAIHFVKRYLRKHSEWTLVLFFLLIQ